MYALTLMPGPFRGYVFAFTGLLMTVFVLVLLIACTNAASLLLARATGRAREMATRAALGAGRARLVRQMLVESLMLAGVAGAAGVAIAWATSRLLMELKPANLPIALDIPMDWRVVLFTAAIISGDRSGVWAGAGAAGERGGGGARAAGRVADRGPQEGADEECAGGGADGDVRGAAGRGRLCVRSLMNANAIDPGFDTRHIALATLDPGSLGYTPEKVKDFYARLLERVKRLPQVTSASYAAFLPLGTVAASETSAGKILGHDPNAMR